MPRPKPNQQDRTKPEAGTRHTPPEHPAHQPDAPGDEWARRLAAQAESDRASERHRAGTQSRTSRTSRNRGAGRGPRPPKKPPPAETLVRLEIGVFVFAIAAGFALNAPSVFTAAALVLLIWAASAARAVMQTPQSPHDTQDLGHAWTTERRLQRVRLAAACAALALAGIAALAAQLSTPA